MVVFDPCILHSATNAEKTRYAYFATYFDAAADYILLPQRGASAPSFKYPPEMKTALSPKYRNILDWSFPDDVRHAIAMLVFSLAVSCASRLTVVWFAWHGLQGHSNYDDRLRFEHFGDLIRTNDSLGVAVAVMKKPDEFEGGSRFGLAAGRSVDAKGASGTRRASKL